MMTMMASSYHHNEQRRHYVRRRFVERGLKYLPKRRGIPYTIK